MHTYYQPEIICSKSNLGEKGDDNYAYTNL